MATQTNRPTIPEIVQAIWDLEYPNPCNPESILRDWDDADPKPANLMHFVAAWCKADNEESLIPLEDGPHCFGLD